MGDARRALTRRLRVVALALGVALTRGCRRAGASFRLFTASASPSAAPMAPVVAAHTLFHPPGPDEGRCAVGLGVSIDFQRDATNGQIPVLPVIDLRLRYRISKGVFAAAELQTMIVVNAAAAGLGWWTSFSRAPRRSSTMAPPRTPWRASGSPRRWGPTPWRSTSACRAAGRPRDPERSTRCLAHRRWALARILAIPRGSGGWLLFVRLLGRPRRRGLEHHVLVARTRRVSGRDAGEGTRVFHHARPRHAQRADRRSPLFSGDDLASWGLSAVVSRRGRPSVVAALHGRGRSPAFTTYPAAARTAVSSPTPGGCLP